MSNYFKHKMRGKSPGVIAAMILFGVIAITGLAILFGFVIMWLWNALMPDLFGLTAITYWQGVGLFILAKILFGGMGSGSSSKSKKSSDDWKCEEDQKKKKKSDFSKWKHYDKFWEEEGDKAYSAYVNRLHGGETTEDTDQLTEENPEE